MPPLLPLRLKPTKLLTGPGVLGLALLLALMPLRLAAVLVVASFGGILALIAPVWALYGAVLAVPFQDIVTLPGGLSLVQAALLLVAGTWTLDILADPTRQVQTGRVLPGLLVLLWALVLATLATPYSRVEAFKETVRWALVALAYLLAVNSSTGPCARLQAAGLVGCLLLAPAANGLVGLWQFVTGTGPPSFIIAGGFARAHGTIGQPNSFAGYMNMAWPLALALAVGAAWMLRPWLLGWGAPLVRWLAPTLPVGAAPQPRPPLHLLLVLLGAGTAALVLVAALFASFSRGAWVGAAGGGAVLLIVALGLLDPPLRRRIWQWAAPVAIASALLLGLVVQADLVPDPIGRRVSSIVNNLRLFDVRTVRVTPENFAVVERMAQIQAAWAMFRDQPITGVGPGNYTSAYEGVDGANRTPYLIPPWYASRGHAHNYYLHLAAEAGLVGLLAYLVLLGLLVAQGRAALARARGWFWRSVAVGGCGIIATVATHNLFENLHVLNMGVQLGAVWGLLVAAERSSPD